MNKLLLTGHAVEMDPLLRSGQVVEVDKLLLAGHPVETDKFLLLSAHGVEMELPLTGPGVHVAAMSRGFAGAACNSL
jgi:hypothetical protein